MTGSRKLLLFLSLALAAFAFSPAWAATKFVPAEGPIEIKVQPGQVSRLVVPAPIQQVLPSSNELSLEMDGAALFIKPMVQGVDRVIWLTADGAAYRVRIKEGSPVDETVQVVTAPQPDGASSGIQEASSAPAPPSPRGEGPAPCLLKALAGGPRCPEASHVALNQVIYKDGFLEVRATNLLNLGSMKGLRAQISNLRKVPLRLSAKDFSFPGAVAVSLAGDYLPPGKETVDLYLVVDERLK
jgi:hypothetical protein